MSNWSKNTGAGEDRFESEGRTNLLEDLVYERYDQTPPVSAEDGAGGGGGAGDVAGAGDAPGAGAAVSDPGEAPAHGPLGEKPPGKPPEIQPAKPFRKPARFSDRVKINQAMRVMTETLLEESVKEQEFLSFFKIPLDSYLHFLRSGEGEAAGAVARQMVRVLRARGTDMSRFEAAKDALRRERLWVERPRLVWHERIGALVGALAEQLDSKEIVVE
ncbi:MAG: hypothetical protein LBL26_09840 [Peptococcaceae bacterium]|nr:hypothetical protein [Peptococcaceae bacterium]